MSVAARILVLALIGLAVPESAQAGLLSWLGRMSGPGPFFGVDLSRCVAVIGGERPRHPAGAGASEEPEPTRGDLAATVALCPELRGGRRYRPHWTFSAVAGLSGSLENQLQREGHDGRAVWVLNAGGTADYTATPWLAVGAGAGINHFFGKDFRAFARPYVEPYVTVRPALLGRSGEIPRASSKGEAVLRSLLVSVGWRVLFADLDGASFGAPSDPFHVHNEGRLSVGLGIDVWAIVDKR
jgi:hypothetical protein